MRTVNVKSLIHTNLAVSPEDGEIIFDELNTAIERKESIRLDFSNLDTITTAFFNSSIGDLYEKWDRGILNQYIHIDSKTLTPLQRKKASNVMENARIKVSQQELRDDMDEG